MAYNKKKHEETISEEDLEQSKPEDEEDASILDE
jgi:hypothetical protein